MKKGWQTKTLGEIGKVSMCKRIFKEETTAIGDIPFYKIGTFGKEPDAFIPNQTYHEYRATYSFPKKGDVLISASGTIGRRLRYGGEPAYFQDSNIVWIDNDEQQVLNDYLYHFYGACEWNSTKGATISRLYNDNLRRIAIGFPKSLPEQQRIVGLLDEAFEGLATAKANAEKNLQNARALFESHLQSVFTQRGPGWVEKSLGDVCEFVNGDRGKNYPNRNEYVETGIPWINTGHIQPNGTLSMEEMNFITREKFDSLRSGKIQSGDLVYCLRGATLGKTALVDPLTEGAVASSLVILRPSSHLDGSFLYFFLTSPAGQGLIKGFENGAAQPNLGAKSVAKYPISFPKLPEQREIADSLIDLHEETQRLARLYEQKLALLTALKKSLLHQAFTGEL